MTHDALFWPVLAPASLTFITGTFHLPLGPGQCIVRRLGVFCHYPPPYHIHCSLQPINIILVSIKKRERKAYLVARKKKGKAYVGACFVLHCQWVQVII